MSTGETDTPPRQLTDMIADLSLATPGSEVFERFALETLSYSQEQAELAADPTKMAAPDYAVVIYERELGELKAVLGGDRCFEVARMAEKLFSANNEAGDPILSTPFMEAFNSRFEDELATIEEAAGWEAEWSSVDLSQIPPPPPDLEEEESDFQQEKRLLGSEHIALYADFESPRELISRLEDYSVDLATYLEIRQSKVEKLYYEIVNHAQDRLEFLPDDRYAAAEILGIIEPMKWDAVMAIYNKEVSPEGRPHVRILIDNALREGALAAAKAKEPMEIQRWLGKCLSPKVTTEVRQTMEPQLLKNALADIHLEEYSRAVDWARWASDEKTKLAVRRALNAALLAKALSVLNDIGINAANSIVGHGSDADAIMAMRKALQMHNEEYETEDE